MPTSNPSPHPSHSRENRIALRGQRTATSAANKQVLHTLPFAAVDDWALECFFDPIANENELPTPEQDRMCAIRMAGYAEVITETFDEVREIVLALAQFQSRSGGEQGGQTERAEHMKPEDDVWAEVSGVKGMTGEHHWRATMIRLGEDESSQYGLQSGATAQDSWL